MRRLMTKLLAVLLVLPATASATLIEISATPVQAPSLLIPTEFQILYEDISGDGVVQVGEVVAFSGFSFSALLMPGQSATIASGLVTGTPYLVGISGPSGDANLFDLEVWVFTLGQLNGPTIGALLGAGPGDTVSFATGLWNYNITTEAPTTTVPAPAALWLLGLGLCAVGCARRQRVV